MIWYVIIAAVAILFLGYRLISAKPKAAAVRIAGKLRVKPSLVEQMIQVMGPERGKMFAEHVTRWGDEDNHGAYTFVVFQVMRNDHPENIRWWKSKLIENGIEPQMDIGKTEIAFTYLKEAGADCLSASDFVRLYNERNA